MEDDFQVVKSRKKRKGRRKGDFGNFHHELGSDSLSDLVRRPDTESRNEVLKKLNFCTKILRDSNYYSKFLESLSEGFEAVNGSRSCPDNLRLFCLGLGAFSSHLFAKVARYQLALLVLLKEEFETVTEVYDPVFTSQEKSILTDDLGFEVTSENEEGKRVIESPTLIFLPHCPNQLINNLLFANWNPSSLANCFIVCNSFSDVSSYSPAYVNGNLCFIRDVKSVCTEIPLCNTFSEHPDVFNDISLHVFPPQRLLDLSENFWLDISVPTYRKEDFISNKK